MDLNQDVCLRPTELRPKFDEWPRVGGVDLALEEDGRAASLIELKRDSSLWHVAWDVAKMGLASRHELAHAGCFLIAAAPIEAWTRDIPGHGLFRSERWDTGAFIDQHRSYFDHYQRVGDPMPLRLPDELVTDFVGDARFSDADEEWELRCIEVTALGKGWVAISHDLEVSEIRTDAPPTEIVGDSVDLQEPATDLNRLRAGEGGSVYLVGQSDLYVDEGAIADMLPPDESLETRRLFRFETTADLRHFAAARQWLFHPRDPKLPGAFAISYSDMRRSFEIVSRDGLIRRQSPDGFRDSRPGPEQWDSFWEEMDRIGVWKWRRWYSPAQFATDGDHWSVLIAHGGRLAVSRGYRAHPPRGELELAALGELVRATDTLLDLGEPPSAGHSDPSGALIT